MEIRPSNMVLTLTRVALRTEYRQVGDKADPLTDRPASACKTKLRLVRDQVGLLGDVCGCFKGCRKPVNLKNSEWSQY